MSKQALGKPVRRRAKKLLRGRLPRDVKTPDDVIDFALSYLEAAQEPCGFNAANTYRQAWEERKDYDYPTSTANTIGSEIYLKGKERAVKVANSPREIWIDVDRYNRKKRRGDSLTEPQDLIGIFRLFKHQRDSDKQDRVAFIALSEIAAVLPILDSQEDPHYPG